VARAFLSLLLISLVGSCPIVCGTAHAASCDHGAGSHHPRGERSDLPAPANDDDCVCNGAIKVKARDTAGSESTGLGQPFDASLTGHAAIATYHSRAIVGPSYACHPPASDRTRHIVLRC
jgi:hypothetical protein